MNSELEESDTDFWIDYEKKPTVKKNIDMKLLKKITTFENNINFEPKPIDGSLQDNE